MFARICEYPRNLDWHARCTRANMRNHLALLTPFASVLFTLAAPSTGHACSIRTCSESRAAPANDTVIPANTPALALSPSFDITGRAGATPPTNVALLDATGAPTPVGVTEQPTAGWYFAAPIKELEPGKEYSLQVSGTCSDVTSSATARFRTSAPSPLPTQAGSLEASKSHMELRNAPTISGSCVSPTEAAVAVITLTPDAALVPFLNTVRVSAKATWNGIPGTEFQVFDYGELKPGEPIVISPYHVCKSVDGGVRTGAPEGRFQVTVTASLAGKGDLPPLATEVELTCQANWIAPGATDPTSTDSKDDSGCTIHPGHANISGTWAVAGVAGIALCGARRRLAGAANRRSATLPKC